MTWNRDLAAAADSPVLAAWTAAADGLARGDSDQLLLVYAEHVDWYDMFLGTLHGNHVVASTLAAMAGRDFDELEVAVVTHVVSGNAGAIEWVQTLRTGERQLRLEGVTMVNLEHGRISRWRDYIQPLKNRKA